ncbi:MAG: protein kinase [Myxococcota bacterium]
MTDTDTVPKTLAGGRYELERELGVGGAASVWLAKDTDLDVWRAVKILTASASERSTIRRRLRAEAKVLARLNHPHILRVVDIGIAERRPFLVMDYVPGGAISDQVRKSGPLQPGHALTICLEVLAALAVAHGKGIVHRDVKPQNILVAEDGRAVLADFGIALIEEGDRRTRTGVAMGSFAFMPPEQRLDAKRVGPTADIYAVGATLYWLLTAKNPVDLFDELDTSVRWAGLPRELVEIIQWATSIEPTDRPQDAAELANRLRDFAPPPVLLRDELDPARFPPPANTMQLETGGLTGTGTASYATSRSVQAASAAAPTLTPTMFPEEKRGLWAIVLALVLVVAALCALAYFLTAPPPTYVRAAPDLDAALDGPVDGFADPSMPGPTANRTEHYVVPQAPAPPIMGGWTGAFDGNPMELQLSGDPSDLRGVVVVSFQGNAIRTPVTGTWNPNSGVLALQDAVDERDSGSYRATRKGGRLQGNFTGRYQNVILPFTLSPANQ